MEKRRILYLFVMLIGVVTGLRAQDETIDLTMQSFTDAEDVDVVEGTGCTLYFEKAGNDRGARPKYYDNGNAVRLYFGNTMTVKASGDKSIVKVNLVFASGGNSNAIFVNTGNYADGTWTGNATEVVFTIDGTRGHRRVQQVQVTYLSAVEAPVISGTALFEESTAVSITAEAGTIIYYTKDGSTPTSSSSIYSSPFTLSNTSTVKAIAIKNGVTSNVAEMLFVKDASLWTGTGTKSDPFIIDTPAKLDRLATRVNEGDPFENTYFKMTADIVYSYESAWDHVSSEENNYTCIGNSMKPFKGIFDGNGHTISGIRVYQVSSYNFGLFGWIDKGAVVKNLTLGNCRFTAGDNTGALVGRVDMGSTLENCHVMSDVCIHDLNNGNWHGGVVGYMYHGKVADCTCSATLSIADDKTCGRYGGIVGQMQSGTLINNLAYNVKLPASSHFSGSGHFGGAVIGHTESPVTSNYYSGCTFGGEAASVGMGSYSSAVSTNEVLATHAFTIGTETPLLRFDDDEPNPDVLESYTHAKVYNGIAYIAEGKPVTVILNNRTLFKDGSWDTLCLPFGIDDLSGSPLAGASVKTLSSATFNKGTLTLSFGDDLTSITAGAPYIVKWNSGSDICAPVFSNVTFSGTEPTYMTGEAASFHGIYSPYSTGGEDKTMLFLGAGNTLHYPNSNMTIDAFHAYFLLNGITAGDSSEGGNTARVFVMHFGDEITEIATTIHPIDVAPYVDTDSETAGWYTLDGRRLSRQPNQSGIYLHNGRKTVLK